MSSEMEQKLEELQKKVSQMKPGADNKMSMVIFSGELDKVLAAFIIATGGAALGLKVVMFFTFWGTAALRDPKKHAKGKNFMSKMFGFMLPRGSKKLKLSKMHMAGAGTAMLKGLMKKKKVASIEEMVKLASQMGVEIQICEMSMDLMGFKKEEMIDYPNMKSAGVATFINEARNSKIQLFI